MLAVAVLWGTSGCDATKKLRAVFHPENGEAPEIGNAGLRVEVEPPDGISILVDERRVASVSTYVNRKLTAGVHRLEIRAMGYYTVTLPIVLADGELVTVPVSLRRRPGTRAVSADAPEPDPSVAAPPEAPSAPAARLPPGVDPIPLQIGSKPAVPTRLDEIPVDGRRVTLERVHGEIRVGVLAIRYRVGGAGLLFFEIPDDGATWSRDGRRLERGTTFKLHRGPTRLRRVASDGTDQTVFLRR
jgi:hypothetical protein